MKCPTCGRDMEPRTHALGAYATITVMSCPICLTTPEPESSSRPRVAEITGEPILSVRTDRVS